MQKEPKQSVSDTLKNFDSLPNSARIRRPVVCALLGWSNTTLHRRIADGTLPAPMKDSPRIATWKVGEIRAVLERTGREDS